MTWRVMLGERLDCEANTNEDDDYAMIGEPLHSPYDLNFRLFGFSIRVTWLFWLLAAAIGYQLCVVYDRAYAQKELESPGTAALLLIWTGAVFLSVLVHELGHAFTMRHFNIDSHIVLYHFGGLAIPSHFKRYTPGQRQRNGYAPQAQLLISLAGPVAQLLLAVVVAVSAHLMGYTYPFSWISGSLGADLSELSMPATATTRAMIDFIILPSVYWALLNLLPVLPLDGGRITQHALAIFRRPNSLYEASMVSMVVAFLVALWGMQSQQPFLGIMFLMLGINNLQTLRGGINNF